MRSILRYGILAMSLVGSTEGARSSDDDAVCGRLTQGNYNPGLYVSYPSDSSAIYHIQDRAICTADGRFCAARISDSNFYHPKSRFFFLPRPRIGDEEGVWHVRTQTRASDVRGADRAYVARPSFRSTRCSPGAPLPLFSDSQSLMPISRYQNHHPQAGMDSPPDAAMTNLFHFQIETKSATPSSCVSTDSATAFGDLGKIYNFENVQPPPQAWARAVSIAANAQTTAFAGLSAEFAYQDDDKPLCFGFSAPRPTAQGVSADGAWLPESTLVVIKRFVRRNVFDDYRQSITWKPR